MNENLIFGSFGENVLNLKLNEFCYHLLSKSFAKRFKSLKVLGFSFSLKHDFQFDGNQRTQQNLDEGLSVCGHSHRTGHRSGHRLLEGFNHLYLYYISLLVAIVLHTFSIGQSGGILK